MQTLLLLLLQAVCLVDDTQVMLAVDMFEITTFGLHFAPYAVRWAHTELDACVNAVSFKYLLSLGDKDIHIWLLRQLKFSQLLLYLFIFTWTAIAERQVFKFRLYVIQTKAIGKRGIEIICLRGNLHLLVRTHTAERAHIMKSVCQFHKYGTHIKLYRR